MSVSAKINSGEIRGIAVPAKSKYLVVGLQPRKFLPAKITQVLVSME